MKAIEESKMSLEKNMNTIIKMKMGGMVLVGDAFGNFASENKNFLEGYEVTTKKEWTAFGYVGKIEVKRK
jgi:hypothetical protein